MKLHKPEPINVIRVNIVSKDEKTESFSLSDCTQDEVINKFKELLSTQKVVPFGKKTAINVRGQYGGKNSGMGKSKSISLTGMTPKQIFDLFIQNI